MERSSVIDADHKFSALKAFPLTRGLPRVPEEKVQTVEMSSFMSVSSSFGWLGKAASPLRAFYISYLQEWIPCNTVMSISLKTDVYEFKLLMVIYVMSESSLEATSIFASNTLRVSENTITDADSGSVVVFVDETTVNEYGKLPQLSAFLIAPLQQEFYVLHIAVDVTKV